ncbi:TniQ family protein [Rhizobium sp. BK418]|uniref:TniQ family protein n=1 Tax=Rhizobium sp. BK418 TaxID=2512120 RepID=UPI00104348DD|nr:TniQ family protein [Rhizobium sp. BK418]TCS06960.1 TniQ protein [Rhizobium sp. BK418]
MRLPVNVLFHPESETPLSLASRLASAMGYSSVADLLGGSTVQAVARGEVDAIKMLSSWSGVPVEQLLRFAVPTSKEAGEWRLGGAVFRKEMRVAGHFRFCPRCLVEDTDNGFGRPRSRPYERASWSTRAVTACTRHRELLVEVGGDAPLNDVALFVAEGWHLECQPGCPVDGAELEVDLYLEGRIFGKQSQSFIDRQEVHVLLMLFQSLGWFVQNHLPSFILGGKPAEELTIRAAGFLIINAGWEMIERVVKEAIDRHRPAAQTIREFFGPLVRHLRRNADAPAYAEVVGLFQALVERNVPVGPGDRFVLPVQNRHLHSIRSAALEYGMDRKRVRKLLEVAEIVQVSSLSDRHVYISVIDAERHLKIASANLNAVEVASILGVRSDRVRELADRNILVPCETGVKGNRPFHRFSRTTIDEFRDRLFRRAPLVFGDHGLVSLDHACRRRSVTQTEIIGLVVNGTLTRIGRSEETVTLGSLLVDLHELPLTVAAEQNLDYVTSRADYLDLTEVKNALATTDVTVSALVKNSVLPVEFLPNPRSLRPQAFVRRSSVAAFLRDHRSLHRIASGWRRNIAWMKSELDENGLKPIFETTGKIARYYRTEDLARACLLPPNA